MATLEWAQLCELAFFDNCERLCMVGITTRLSVPCLPLAVHQLMVAARLVGVQPGQAVEVNVGILTPDGRATSPAHDTSLDVMPTSEYLLITLRDIPLMQEGLHRVVVSADGGEPLVLDVPIALASQPTYANVH